MIDLLKMTAEHAANYAQGINDRSVFPSAEAIARLDELNERLPDGPSDPADVVSLLDEICSPATVATTGGRYYGFVTGGVLPAALAANWLAGAWDPGERREPIDHTPEMSRRARAIEIWAALRSLGRSGLSDLVERCCDHARRFAEGLSVAGYQVLNDVVLNQVLVSFGNKETTRRVIAEIQTDGTCWCGGTIWQGQDAMRISVSSWATTNEDVERSLAAMIRVARACA